MPRNVLIENVDSLSAKRTRMFQEMSKKGLLPAQAESDRLTEQRLATFAADSDKQQVNYNRKSEEYDGDDTEPFPNENEDAEPSLPIVRLR